MDDLSKLEQDINKDIKDAREQKQVVAKADDSKAVDNLKSKTLEKINEDFVSGKVNADEGMKQMVNVLTIVEATADEDLKHDLKKEASKGLKSYMKGIAYKDEENKLQHKQQRNEAFYKAFRPILEFDLSHLIGKRKKRIVEKDKATGKKTVRYEKVEEEPEKSYKDRSYGLTLMLIMIGLFIVPYMIANFALAVFRMINSLFECFEQFGRTAFWICTSIAGIAIIGSVVLIILLLIQALFNVQIFG